MFSQFVMIFNFQSYVRIQALRVFTDLILRETSHDKNQYFDFIVDQN